DLAVANNGDSTFSILAGNGDGTFGLAANSPTTSKPISITETDVDSDGKKDLIVLQLPQSGLGDSPVTIEFGQGDGTFVTGQNMYTGTRPVSLSASDVNGDGHPDLVVANSVRLSTASGYVSNNTVSVLVGNGDGTFGAPQSFVVGYNPTSVAVADINGDGR